ncbi:MAG: hypothetical protein JWN64_607 [Parcubacteria group bacterium]|nr:hypothetical protein [Parcubacteria group bacterium]
MAAAIPMREQKVERSRKHNKSETPVKYLLDSPKIHIKSGFLDICLLALVPESQDPAPFAMEVADGEETMGEVRPLEDAEAPSSKTRRRRKTEIEGRFKDGLQTDLRGALRKFYSLHDEIEKGGTNSFILILMRGKQALHIDYEKGRSKKGSKKPYHVRVGPYKETQIPAKGWTIYFRPSDDYKPPKPKPEPAPFVSKAQLAAEAEQRAAAAN